MIKPIHLKLNLREFDEWVGRSTGLTLAFFKGDVISFLQTAEEMPPMRLDRLVRPLVVDEGVDLGDIIFTVVDEETGEEYYYNPQGMDVVFAQTKERNE
jgi:hypothetical protein